MEDYMLFNCIIFDSDETCIQDLDHLLAHDHFWIDKVSDRIEALFKIIYRNYDYYFINMDIEGFYLIDLIKELKQKPKIIAITSEKGFGMERKIRGLGITYLLKKPFSDREISDLTHNLLFISGNNHNQTEGKT